MNAYYNASIKDFLQADGEDVLKTLAFYGSNEPNQVFAWVNEISLMKKILVNCPDEEAQILFEYTIPRLNKRADVIVLLRGIVFCIEFKVNATEYLAQDKDQVMDYALDLKNFHQASHDLAIVPILVATNAPDTLIEIQPSRYNDMVYTPMLVNAKYLSTAITKVLALEHAKPFEPGLVDRWVISRYEPTPTIVEAAQALYVNHSVEDITRTEASGEQLQITTNYILDVIRRSHVNKEKSICFVTGVPGAGKTLVGLNVAIEQEKKMEGESKDNLAVYLSGNGPLVKVLTAALARDKALRTGATVSDSQRQVKRFIQEIYNYREQMLNKIKTPVQNGVLEIDPSLASEETNAGYGEIEHIAIFDEAQRAWNHQKLAYWLERGGSYGNKKKVPNFPMSEAEFLIWSMNLRKDWAVIVCLVGGGQEIHSGEAGIGEWINACNKLFPNWNVYISDHLTDKEYAEGNVKGLLANNPKVTYSPDLHLAVSMRSFRAEKLSLMVHHILDRKPDEARAIYQEIKDKYPIVLTRDLNFAKDWLRDKARGTERYGIIVSSKADRLRPLAIDVKRSCDVVKWFLDDKKDLRSSMFLEDVATEFDVQGLELDWTCLVWDGDLRYTETGWDYNQFSYTYNRWNKNKQEINQSYQLNAYRVLLTRARQGMVICVPNGVPYDDTRKPEYYDKTYEYLAQIFN